LKDDTRSLIPLTQLEPFEITASDPGRMLLSLSTIDETHDSFAR